MSVGSNLQEMENVVTKGAAQAEPMQKLSTGIAPGQTGSWEDLGGPTPENYKVDDDSAKLKDPSATLAQVKDVVNAKAAKADAMKKMAEETEEDEEDFIAEEEVTEAMEEDEDEEEATPKKKKKGAKEESEDEDEDEDEGGMKKEEFNIEEDVNALLAGEELSEEFQEKARTIFETAIKSKVAEIKE